MRLVERTWNESRNLQWGFRKTGFGIIRTRRRNTIWWLNFILKAPGERIFFFISRFLPSKYEPIPFKHLYVSPSLSRHQYIPPSIPWEIANCDYILPVSPPFRSQPRSTDAAFPMLYRFCLPFCLLLLRPRQFRHPFSLPLPFILLFPPLGRRMFPPPPPPSTPFPPAFVPAPTPPSNT